MKPTLAVKLAACLAIALALFFAQPACQAKTNTAKAQKNLDKQARKIQSELSRYQAGTLLLLTMRDGTQTTGKLGTLSDASFAFTNADSNANETHSYSDVKKVEKAKEYIGEGSTHHHIHIL
jgi:hypothetical protein